MLKLKNFTPLFLVLLLVTPTLVKIGHHHEDFICKNPHEKHIHQTPEKCFVCSFEFSTFSDFKISTEILKLEISCAYECLLYKKPSLENSKYSFLLRAPPLQ